MPTRRRDSFNTVTSQWSPRRLKSAASRLFAQPFVQTHVKEKKIKAPRHWPLRGQSTGGQTSNEENVFIWLRHHDLARPGPWFNIKMSSYQYRKSHCGDKTILRPSYIHNGISYAGKMTSLYWIMALGYIRYGPYGAHICIPTAPPPPPPPPGFHMASLTIRLYHGTPALNSSGTHTHSAKYTCRSFCNVHNT